MTDDNSAEAEQSPHPAATQNPAIPDKGGKNFIENVPFGPLQHNLEQMSLLDIYKFAQTHAGYWNNPQFWADVKATHPHIKDGKTAVQIARYMQTHLSEMIQNGGRSFARNDELLAKIDAAYTPEFAQGIQGFLGFHWIFMRMGVLSYQGTVVTEEMQKVLNEDARYARFGFYGVTGHAYLVARVEAGDTHAQQMLNEAAFDDGLGLFRNAAERRQYLENRARNYRDAYAQEKLSTAAQSGWLGFSSRGTNLTYFFAVYNALTGAR